MRKRTVWMLGMLPPLALLIGSAWAHVNHAPGLLTSYGIDFVLPCGLIAGIYQIGEENRLRRPVLLVLSGCAALCFCLYELVARERGVGTFDPIDMLVYVGATLYATGLWAISCMGP